MTPEAIVIANHRKGIASTAREVAATIRTIEELDAYHNGLQARGALSGEMIVAIEARRTEIKRG